MKTKRTRSLRRLQLKITYYSAYKDQIEELEKVVARKPRRLQLDIIGSGELPPDCALLIRTILKQRSARTQLITNARSSLQGGAALIWLLGDRRLLREDAKIFFRKSTADEDAEPEWMDRATACETSADCDLEEADYLTVLRHINEFLPVKEFGDQALDASVLRQFGLVENESMDEYLATVFAQEKVSKRPPKSPPEKPPSPSSTESTQNGQSFAE